MDADQKPPSSGFLRNARVDLRRRHRFPGKGAMLRASWIGQTGELKMALVRLINISEEGLALELPEAPQKNSVVRIHAQAYKIMGLAQVRHVRRAGHKYMVGVEFSNGLRWSPPPGQGAESNDPGRVPVVEAMTSPAPAPQNPPANLNKPAEITKPVDVSKPSVVSKPVDLSKPAEISKPSVASKPAEISKPADINAPAPSGEEDFWGFRTVKSAKELVDLIS